MKGDPPCGCDPTCKVNGTCCGDYEEYCEACSKGCKDKPGCKCSNCSVDCCENFEQTCLNPRTTSSTYFPFATLPGPSGKK
uniref:Fibrillin-1-like n=1 Tax=Phallusia mammillata TaxID=59560 RepID=A0A6F9DC18_9ASCI|nr:fibrillin-1-like [Phallusia mammillata]